MEGIIEKALKEDLPDILNLQKKAFEKVAMEENNFNILPMTRPWKALLRNMKKDCFKVYIGRENYRFCACSFG